MPIHPNTEGCLIMLPERISARSRRRLTAVRAARLIDALIDQVHRDWPRRRLRHPAAVR